jgi:transposase
VLDSAPAAPEEAGHADRGQGLNPRLDPPPDTPPRHRGIIPERPDQVAHRAAKGSHGGRPPAFGKEVYGNATSSNAASNRLKQWRDLATRYAKRAALYRSSLRLISALRS